MVSKTFCIASLFVLASFALSSAAGATCSTASLSGTYGFPHSAVDNNGAPISTAVSQITFDSTTGTFTGETTASHEGVTTSFSFAGKYAVAPNCTGTGLPAGGNPFAFVITSTGFFAVHKTGEIQEGFAVKQGSPCTKAGVQGSFGFQATGVYVAGAPVTGPVALIGELKLGGDGVISGHIAGREDGTLLEEPVTGTYWVDSDCNGRATITPNGQPEMRFRLVVVDGGNEMLAIQTDYGTVVSATLQRLFQQEMSH
jgi:hypothetical protein